MRWILATGIAAMFVSSACTGDGGFQIPPPPTTGFQLQLAPVTVEPGQDLEFCSYFNLETEEDVVANGQEFLLEKLIANGIDPRADELAVDKIEVKGVGGLHHIQILALKNDLEDVPDKHIFECAIDLFGGPLTGDVDPIFFTQQGDLAVDYDEGVGRILYRVKDKDDPMKTRGTQLLYNFHYLNATTAPITAQAVVNLHVVPRETIVHPVRSAWWNFIYFEATSGQPSGVDARGSFLVDVNLVGATSHVHQMGTSFSYTIGEEKVYENKDWSEPQYLRFDGGRRLAKDEPVDFRCEWHNSSDWNRYFGLQADDEMCTAILEYYPVDEAEAEALLAQQRAEAEMNMRMGGGPFSGDAVTLERFLGFPEELIDMIAADPDHAFDILDKDIMCGIAVNLKQMEVEYGRAPDVLHSLQALLEFLTPICRL